MHESNGKCALDHSILENVLKKAEEIRISLPEESENVWK